VNRKPFLSVFTQLAQALVFDLGLNKPLPKDPDTMLNFNSHGCPRPLLSTVRTMEERRAVLSCFLVSSMYVFFSLCFSESQANIFSISSYLQRIDALRWTPHMDECLQTLAEKQECPTDEVLVQQVRLQLIVEKVTQARWHDGEIENAGPVRAPPAFYLKALQSQLQEVKRKLPPESQQNGKLSSTNYFHVPS
jgi:hypothetical protein